LNFEDEVNEEIQKLAIPPRLTAQEFHVLVSSDYTVAKLTAATLDNLIHLGISPGAAKLLKMAFPLQDASATARPPSGEVKIKTSDGILGILKLLKTFAMATACIVAFLAIISKTYFPSRRDDLLLAAAVSTCLLGVLKIARKYMKHLHNKK